MSADATTAIETIATTPVLLIALDFDGTVSELRDDPMAVRAIPEAAAALEHLSALPDTFVAFVSGRSLRDLAVIAERAEDSPVLLSGSHGAEYLVPAALGAVPAVTVHPPADLAVIESAVRAAVAEIAGARIEDKAYGFALHTRLADERATAAAQQAVDGVMVHAEGWRRRGGHDVIEYAWRSEGKNDGVERLRTLTGATAVVFAGDDVSDEDALRALGAGDLGIRVGEGVETAAKLTVPTPQALAALLAQVAAVRAQRSA